MIASLVADAVAFPIPAPAGTPPWVGILFLLAGAATFAVLVWQAVRYFRENGDEQPRRETRPDGAEGGDGHEGRSPDFPDDGTPDRPHDPPR